MSFQSLKEWMRGWRSSDCWWQTVPRPGAATRNARSPNHDLLVAGTTSAGELVNGELVRIVTPLDNRLGRNAPPPQPPIFDAVEQNLVGIFLKTGTTRTPDPVWPMRRGPDPNRPMYGSKVGCYD